jgi:hypothetical protein
VTGWKYVADTDWHVRVARKTFPFANAYVVRDGAIQPETALLAEKLAILNLIAQCEAGSPETLIESLDFNNPD